MGQVFQSWLLSSGWMESEYLPDNAIFALMTIKILIPKPFDEYRAGEIYAYLNNSVSY